MTKYYNKEIPDKVNVVYDGRHSGKTYYEFNKIKKENKKLKSRINKALKYIGSITEVKVRYFDYRNIEKESLHISHEELKRRIKEQHLEGHFIEIDRNDLLKILKGEE